MTWTLRIERMPDSALNINRVGSRHWRSRSQAKKADTGDAHALALAHGLDSTMPWKQAWVVITLYPPDGRKRDIDNFGGACKAFLDGITLAGVLTDDSVIKAVTYQWGDTSGPATEIEIDGEP